METLFVIWFVHVAIGLILSSPILLVGRKRVIWTRWDLLAFAVPFAVWAALMLSPLATGRKSMANIGEPVYISFALVLAAFARVCIGQRIPEKTCAISLVAVLCAVAAATFFLVPMKSE